MRNLIIANYGSAYKGKSTTVKEVFKLLSSRYPGIVTIFHPLSSGDVKAIIEVQGILVGVESQGDPDSRIYQSLKDFQSAGCKIIIAACRSYGNTTKAIDQMHKFDYQVIWTSNDKNWDDDSIVNYLNYLYAEHIVQLVEDRIANKF